MSYACVAQPVEQLICNQQVGGSNPSTGSISKPAKACKQGLFLFYPLNIVIWGQPNARLVGYLWATASETGL